MMRISHIYFLFLPLALFAHQSAALSIFIEWQYVLQSNHIVFVENIQVDNKSVRVKVLEVLGGEEETVKQGSELWFKAFHDRYCNKVGDTYVAFINRTKPNNQDHRRVENSDNNSQLSAYHQALFNGEVFKAHANLLKVRNNKVQYNLDQYSSVGAGHQWSDWEEFRSFLRAYSGKTDRKKVSRNIVKKVDPKEDLVAQTQLLLMLQFLEYDKYHRVFGDFVYVSDQQAKIALAKLMGNIASKKSNKVLRELMWGDDLTVSGEAVRQLKRNNKAKYLGEIFTDYLIAYIEASPSDIRRKSPQHREGLSEVINALGELNYSESIPYLIVLSGTNNQSLFLSVISSLGKINKELYVQQLNAVFDNHRVSVAPGAIRMVINDSLYECLPHVKSFISKCDKSLHTNTAYILPGEKMGLASLADEDMIKFFLEDFDQFLDGLAVLKTSAQVAWMSSYIRFFRDLKVKEASPLLYKAIKIWYGIDPYFVRYPELFELKQKLEDSISLAFDNNSALNDYNLKNCIAYIQNVEEVVGGAPARVNYALFVESGSNISQENLIHRALVAREVNIPLDNILMKDASYKSLDMLWIPTEFYATSVFSEFIRFIKSVPDAEGIGFLNKIILVYGLEKTDKTGVGKTMKEIVVSSDMN